MKYWVKTYGSVATMHSSPAAAEATELKKYLWEGSLLGRLHSPARGARRHACRGPGQRARPGVAPAEGVPWPPSRSPSPSGSQPLGFSLLLSG